MAKYTAEYAAFRRKLRKARTDLGLSQSVVARRIGKPQSFISKCESGERRVDVVELRLFAEVYGKALDYFLP